MNGIRESFAPWLLSDKFLRLRYHLQLRLLCFLPFKPGLTLRVARNLRARILRLLRLIAATFFAMTASRLAPQVGRKGRL